MGGLAKKGEERIPCTAQGAKDAQLVHAAGSGRQVRGERHLQAGPEKSGWHGREGLATRRSWRGTVRGLTRRGGWHHWAQADPPAGRP